MRIDPRNDEPLNDRSLAAESREGFKATQIGARLARYGKARENALQFVQYLDQVAEMASDRYAQKHYRKISDALADCGNFATFRDYFTIGEMRLSHFCTCKKHLICPLCAIRRGAKALRVYLARVQHLLSQNSRLRPFLVTLTVKNGPDLDERYRHLSHSQRAYHKRRKGTRQKGEIRKASSAVWSYELTNRGKGWHPHSHAIWLCEETPDPFKLSEEWRELTGDSYIVDVRPLDMTDPVGAFAEVFKYAIKFADLADSDRLHAFETLQGKRLLDSFGELRGLDIEPADSDDLLEDLPYIERMFAYVQGVGYVEKEPTGEILGLAA